MVGVVESDADDLAGSRDRRADPRVARAPTASSVAPRVHELAQPGDAVAGEERRVVVGDLAGDVEDRFAVEDGRLLGARIADAQQLHEASPITASASISTSSPGGSPT